MKKKWVFIGIHIIILIRNILNLFIALIYNFWLKFFRIFIDLHYVINLGSIIIQLFFIQIICNISWMNPNTIVCSRRNIENDPRIAVNPSSVFCFFQFVHRSNHYLCITTNRILLVTYIPNCVSKIIKFANFRSCRFFIIFWLLKKQKKIGNREKLSIYNFRK